MNKLIIIYEKLFNTYGPQGWWPLLDCKGVNPTKTGAVNGYHPNDYSYPKNKDEQFEICIGAILAQNTMWPNVEKALINLKKINAISPENILSIDEEKLKTAINPAGYFNQKARKLRNFAEFYIKLNGKIPTRDELLSIWGVGPETADSILLYGYKTPSFVVDAYSKRIFSRIGIMHPKLEYDEIKTMFETNLEKDFKIYQEYHALIVEHAKRYCQKKPLCEKCIIKDMCKKIF